MPANTTVSVSKRDKVGKVLKGTGIVVAFAFITIILVMIFLRLTDSAKDERMKEAQEVSERIIATTEDVSGGLGTVRVRRTTVGAGTQGCTVTVQQYVRTNPESLYREPPQYISHGCSGL